MRKWEWQEFFLNHNLVLFHFLRHMNLTSRASQSTAMHIEQSSSRKRLKWEFNITKMIIAFLFLWCVSMFSHMFFRCFYTFSCGDSAGGLNCVGNPLVRGFPRATWWAEPFMWWAEHIKYHECDITYRYISWTYLTRCHEKSKIFENRWSRRLRSWVELSFPWHEVLVVQWHGWSEGEIEYEYESRRVQGMFKGRFRLRVFEKLCFFDFYFWYILHIFYHWTVGGHLRWVAPHPAIFHANFSPCNILLPALKTQ